MKSLITFVACSTLSIISMAADSKYDTQAIITAQCYNSTQKIDGKDSVCYSFMNPPPYWSTLTTNTKTMSKD